MNDLRVGVVFLRKKLMTDDGVVTVYKAIDYGYCSHEDTTLHFYSGKYTNKQIENIMYNTTSDLCAGPYSFKNFIYSGFSNIDEKIKKWFSKEWVNKYATFNNDTFFTDIEDPILIEKCIKVFGDIVVENIVEDTIDDEYEEVEEDNENTFIQYDIEEKYRILKEHVFGQDEQLKEVLSCIIKNLNLADSGFSKDMVAKLKSNILLLGKTGVGKTLMIKEISKLLNVPYVIEDATRYTGSGWSGEDVENMLRNLYVASNKNITNAEMGILVVDEFDKLCKNSEKSTHSTISVQQNLLKLIEGTKINISKTNHTDIGGFQFDTSKLTIIFAGAFDGIDKIIEKKN